MIKKFAKGTQNKWLCATKGAQQQEKPKRWKTRAKLRRLYQIYHEAGICICKIQSLQGQQLNCSWNVTEFKDIIHWSSEKHIVDLCIPNIKWWEVVKVHCWSMLPPKNKLTIT